MSNLIPLRRFRWRELPDITSGTLLDRVLKKVGGALRNATCSLLNGPNTFYILPVPLRNIVGGVYEALRREIRESICGTPAPPQWACLRPADALPDTFTSYRPPDTDDCVWGVKLYIQGIEEYTYQPDSDSFRFERLVQCHAKISFRVGYNEYSGAHWECDLRGYYPCNHWTANDRTLEKHYPIQIKKIPYNTIKEWGTTYVVQITTDRGRSFTLYGHNDRGPWLRLNLRIYRVEIYPIICGPGTQPRDATPEGYPRYITGPQDKIECPVVIDDDDGRFNFNFELKFPDVNNNFSVVWKSPDLHVTLDVGGINFYLVKPDDENDPENDIIQNYYNTYVINENNNNYFAPIVPVVIGGIFPIINNTNNTVNNIRNEVNNIQNITNNNYNQLTTINNNITNLHNTVNNNHAIVVYEIGQIVQYQQNTLVKVDNITNNITNLNNNIQNVNQTVNNTNNQVNHIVNNYGPLITNIDNRTTNINNCVDNLNNCCDQLRSKLDSCIDKVDDNKQIVQRLDNNLIPLVPVILTTASGLSVIKGDTGAIIQKVNEDIIPKLDEIKQKLDNDIPEIIQEINDQSTSIIQFITNNTNACCVPADKGQYKFVRIRVTRHPLDSRVYFTDGNNREVVFAGYLQWLFMGKPIGEEIPIRRKEMLIPWNHFATEYNITPTNSCTIEHSVVTIDDVPYPITTYKFR